MIDDEAQLTVTEGRHVSGSALGIEDTDGTFFVQPDDICVFVIGNDDDLLAVVSGYVVVEVTVQVGEGGQGKKHCRIVAPQIDAVFLEIESDCGRGWRPLLTSIADEWRTIQINIVHTFLHQVHHVGECHEVF